MAFLAKMKNSFSSFFSFFADSWAELKKVRWPNRKELTSYTIVVFVTVIFVTLYFMLLDMGITEILHLIF